MNESNKEPINLDEILFVKSSYLKNIRLIVKELEDFRLIFGVVAQFRVVVDTNVVLRDIMWLCKKRKKKEAITNFMEIIEAETISVYAPPQLLEEVEEKIPLLAKEKGIDENLLREQWDLYKTKLRIKEPNAERVKILQSGVDPDDAFFVALAGEIGAAGIFSHDKHIEQMGGNRITVECVASLRDYSRSIAVNMNIKVSGVVLTGLSVAALRSVFLGITGLYKVIANAPDWVKLTLILGALFVVFNPQARTALVDWLKQAMDGIKDATPVVTEHLTEAIILAGKKGDEAQEHLEAAMKELILDKV